MCAGGMKDLRHHYDWTAGLIDRMLSQMQCKKKNYQKGFQSLLEWRLWIHTPELELGRTGRESWENSGRSPEARGAGFMWKVSGSCPQTAKKKKSYEESILATLSHPSTTTLEEPFSDVDNTQPQQSCSVANCKRYVTALNVTVNINVKKRLVGKSAWI